MPDVAKKPPEVVEVLIECRRRQLALLQADETWIRALGQIEDHLEQLEHGPAWGGWFKPSRPHERMRRLRAIAKLEKAGLVVRRMRWGRRLSSIKLTEQGMKLASELELK